MSEDLTLNHRLVSVAQIVSLLEGDPDAAKEFARDPKAFLEHQGLGPNDLEAGHGHKAIARAQEALDLAKLGANETLSSALPKLSTAATDVFGSDYRVEVEPFAIRFLEKPTLSPGIQWTITGHVRCTFDGWDGCSAGLDW